MKAVEKRDLLVKEVLKPMFKEAGFKSKRTNWWKELEDGYLFIYMKNSRFNCVETGCNFSFQFSASYKDDIRDKVENQWIYNQMECIEERAFLPYFGELAPNRASGYKIDGYRKGQPMDVPTEEIFTQIKQDFENYIMPHVTKIQNVRDFMEMKETLQKRIGTKEDLLLRYYGFMCGMCYSENSLPIALKIQKDFGLTAKEIRSHYDWLAIIACNFGLPEIDVRLFIEKLLSV